HRLAGAGATDDAQHLAAHDVEIEMVVDDGPAEAVNETAHLDDDVALLVVFSARVAHMPSTEKMIENAASRAMIRKMDSPTERVVSLPTLSALRSTRMPSKQPTSAMTKAKTGALMRPTISVLTLMAPCSSRMKAGMVMPRSK